MFESYEEFINEKSKYDKLLKKSADKAAKRAGSPGFDELKKFVMKYIRVPAAGNDIANAIETIAIKDEFKNADAKKRRELIEREFDHPDIKSHIKRGPFDKDELIDRLDKEFGLINK